MCLYDDSDRCTGAVSASTINTNPPASSTVFDTRSRRLSHDDVTKRDDVTGHVVLSSTRLVEKLTATLNALTVDCRQTGARYHGNTVATVTSDSATKFVRNPASNNDATAEISNIAAAADDSVRLADTSEDVIGGPYHSEEHITPAIDCQARLESDVSSSEPGLPGPTLAESLTGPEPQTGHIQQQRADDGEESSDGDGSCMTHIAINITLDKGPLGLGFCIDGGLDAPSGPAPVTIKRLFKGKTPLHRTSWCVNRTLVVSVLTLQVRALISIRKHVFHNCVIFEGIMQYAMCQFVAKSLALLLLIQISRQILIFIDRRRTYTVYTLIISV